MKIYSIMYRNDKVLDLICDSYYKVSVYNRKFLPFTLRNCVITPSVVQKWLKDRLDRSFRKEMEYVYQVKGIKKDDNGVDIDAIILDSFGISFIDNYWINLNNQKVTWIELLEQRDKNSNLLDVALFGKIDKDKDYSGYTSLFTTTGFFPKYIKDGYVYKRRSDSLMEFVAYLIGKQLGFDIPECELVGDYVKIKIFTNEKISLIHALDLKKYFGTTDEIYTYFQKKGNMQFVNQLQRLYIFNYIIGNPDVHEENHGLLYDAETFEFLSINPFYDHNSAFQEFFDGLTRTTIARACFIDIADLTQQVIKKHSDLVDKLIQVDLSQVQGYLTNRQFTELKERIYNVVDWHDKED